MTTLCRLVINCNENFRNDGNTLCNDIYTKRPHYESGLMVKDTVGSWSFHFPRKM